MDAHRVHEDFWDNDSEIHMTAVDNLGFKAPECIEKFNTDEQIVYKDLLSEAHRDVQNTSIQTTAQN